MVTSEGKLESDWTKPRQGGASSRTLQKCFALATITCSTWQNMKKKFMY